MALFNFLFYLGRFVAFKLSCRQCNNDKENVWFLGYERCSYPLLPTSFLLLYITYNRTKPTKLRKFKKHRPIFYCEYRHRFKLHGATAVLKKEQFDFFVLKALKILEFCKILIYGLLSPNTL
ncbi:MAG: hypothetical protein K0R18_2509 [Bacillales bacterium]|nr:hypothetical protein [Bacillales bacterium]